MRHYDGLLKSGRIKGRYRRSCRLLIRMIYLKTDEEIELMRAANQLVGKTLGEIGQAYRSRSQSTLQLDKIAEEFIRDNGAVPAFLGYGGFPNSICASVNEQVVHGIPSSKTILERRVT